MRKLLSRALSVVPWIAPLAACGADSAQPPVPVVIAPTVETPRYFPPAQELTLQALPTGAPGTHRVTARLDDAGLAALEAMTGTRQRAVVRALDGRDVVLHDDGKGGDPAAGDGRFTFSVTLDPQAIATRAALEEAAGDQGLLTELSRFEGHALVETYDRPALASTALADGEEVAFAPLPVTATAPSYQDLVDRALFITDPLVLNDPNYAASNCVAGTSQAPFSFGYLMRQMAGNQDPVAFVEHWLDTMTQTQSTAGTNGFTLPPMQAAATLRSNWPVDGNGDLMLEAAPLELIAIVPRLDLRTAPSNLSSGGGDEGGELRFIFAATDSSCSRLDFSVILEYGKPITSCAAMHGWAQSWLALAAIDPVNDTTNYLAHLEALTRTVTDAGANREKPNDSALNQLRINALEPARSSWVIREFHLMGSGLLEAATTAETPDNTFRGQVDYPFFDALIQTAPSSGVPLSMLDQNNQPRAFLGAEANVRFPGDQFPWGFYNDLNNFNTPQLDAARHARSLATCSGCHGTETDTLHAHMIHPVTGAMSPFLVGDGPNTPHPVIDDFTGTTRYFHDLRRRQQDLIALASALCADLVIDDFWHTSIPE